MKIYKIELMLIWSRLLIGYSPNRQFIELWHSHFSYAKLSFFSIFLQVTVEVRDNLRGLGSGVKRSIDDVDSKSYIRAKTRERFEQPKSATSGTVKFVAADTTRPEKESSSNFNEINDISVQKPGSSQELPLTLKTEELDIFAEWKVDVKTL